MILDLNSDREIRIQIHCFVQMIVRIEIWTVKGLDEAWAVEAKHEPSRFVLLKLQDYLIDFGIL